MQREDLRKSLAIDERNRDGNREESEQERNSRIECMIDEMERRRKELKVEELSFNSFTNTPSSVFRTSVTRTTFRA